MLPSYFPLYHSSIPWFSRTGEKIKRYYHHLAVVPASMKWFLCQNYLSSLFVQNFAWTTLTLYEQCQIFVQRTTTLHKQRRHFEQTMSSLYAQRRLCANDVNFLYNERPLCTLHKQCRHFVRTTSSLYEQARYYQVNGQIFRERTLIQLVCLLAWVTVYIDYIGSPDWLTTSNITTGRACDMYSHWASNACTTLLT